MKNQSFILALCILFSCFNSVKGNNGLVKQKIAEFYLQSSFKKYDIKSGIITFETSIQMMGMDIKTKKILYFDDYGLKECEEEYELNEETGKDELISKNFVKDGFRYTCSFRNKSGVKTKAMGYGVVAQFNVLEAQTLKDNNYKKLGNETVCGKNCESFSTESSSGIFIMFGWNKITLKTVLDNASMEMKSTTIATKIEENVAIPKDIFEIPTDMKITDM